MYVNYEDRPVCPGCKKRLQFVKAESSNSTLYYWECGCLHNLATDNVEPDIVFCMDEED